MSDTPALNLQAPEPQAGERESTVGVPEDGTGVPAEKSGNNGTNQPRAEPTAPRIRTRQDWLNSIYLNTRPFSASPMLVRDFLKTTETSHREHLFWQDCHVDWALELVRRRHKNRTDFHIMSPVQVGLLYGIATIQDYLPARDSQAFRIEFEPLREELDSKPIIIIPVNNGLHQERAPSVNRVWGDGSGTHWSFIVVNRRNKAKPIARYLDGLVRTEPSGTQQIKWTIRGTEINGHIAGMILCGFDSLLDLQKGAFDAKTLRFVPHMYNNNRTKDDYGACGPHMYALLEHLLAGKKVLIDPVDGLDANFNNPARRANAAADFNFDSRVARGKLAAELMRERRTVEKSCKDLCVDNLTPELLASILTIDDLIHLARTPHQQPHRPGGNGGNDGSGDGGGSDSDSDSEGSDGDGDFGNPPVPKAAVREELNENPTTYELVPDKTQRWQMAYESILEREKTRENAEREELLEVGKIPADPTYRSIIILPEDMDDLPRAFSDETVVSETQLKKWVGANEHLIETMKLGHKANHLSQRAGLQVLSGVSFTEETPTRLRTIWINDPEVFTSADRADLPIDGAIAWRMAERYQVAELEKFGWVKLPVKNPKPAGGVSNNTPGRAGGTDGPNGTGELSEANTPLENDKPDRNRESAANPSPSKNSQPAASNTPTEGIESSADNPPSQRDSSEHNSSSNDSSDTNNTATNNYPKRKRSDNDNNTALPNPKSLKTNHPPETFLYMNNNHRPI
ncbi:hypothetical protein BDU57DRAFT_581659 [Ampelomyces quisqualis]|uniref:Ubiquitin-like protease family profile domain-containing protein n=1 Tax=Ampelomyces quisqualis TaxID=50730 RepID=A0A6A5QC58_AMPQU|nr:hypothetical protein BDU57DRAFT_581659 [Ampelomyces quisqualis]